MRPADLLDTFEAQRAFAILRSSDPDWLFTAADTLVAAGITTLEVSLTSADPLRVISAIAESHHGRALLGAGTVTTPAEAEAAVAAGARFLVSPVVAPDVAAWAAAHDVGLLAGALTPTEVLAAWRAGAAAVKVFPVSAAGGADYVRALRGPFPAIPLVPVGGFTIEDVPAYLAAGATAVGLGSPLVGARSDLATRAARLRDLTHGATT